MRNTLFFVIVTLVLLTGATEVFAHATPVTYEPESSALVEKIPDHVRIHFSERIESAASNITVLAPDGAEASEAPSVDPHDSHFFESNLRDAGRGTYTVVWQVVSADDGHFTKGAFTFSVGKETAAAGGSAGQIQIQHITTIPQATVMWIELVGQSILWGALFLIIGIWRPLSRTSGREILPNSFNRWAI